MKSGGKKESGAASPNPKVVKNVGPEHASLSKKGKGGKGKGY